MATEALQREDEQKGVAAVNYRTFNKEYEGLPQYFPNGFKPLAEDDNEKTGAQTLAKPTSMDGLIYPLEQRLDTFTYLKLLRDPTIALARCLMVAPITLVPIIVKVDPDAPEGAEELIQEQIIDRKDVWMKLALEGCIDFGWTAFENVYEFNREKQVCELKKQKQLLHEITWLRANPYTGDFAGIMQDNIITGRRVYLDQNKIQLFNFDQRGSNWYGNSILDNAVLPSRRWYEIEEMAVGYMRKIGGAHWVIKYPVGTTNCNGVNKDNAEIAQELLKNLEANGAIAIPQDLELYRFTQESGQAQQWVVENMTDSGATSASYADTLRYYDTLKVRGMMLPERMILEGEFGTKAEAVAHSEAAVAGMEMRYRGIVRDMDAQTKRQLLALNFGEKYRDCVRLTPAEITRDDKQFMKEIYNSLLGNSDVGHVVASGVDIEQLQQLLAIPKNEKQAEVLKQVQEQVGGMGNEDNFGEPEQASEENAPLPPRPGLKLLDAHDAEEKLGVSATTIKNWRKHGLNSYKVGGGKPMFDETELEDFIRKHGTSQADAPEDDNSLEEQTGAQLPDGLY